MTVENLWINDIYFAAADVTYRLDEEVLCIAISEVDARTRPFLADLPHAYERGERLQITWREKCLTAALHGVGGTGGWHTPAPGEKPPKRPKHFSKQLFYEHFAAAEKFDMELLVSPEQYESVFH